MLDILLVIHIVIAVLLVTVILLQKTSADGLGSLGGNSGFVSAKTAANFLVKITVVLASLFIINSLILANLSTKKHKSILEEVIKDQKQQDSSVPIAK